MKVENIVGKVWRGFAGECSKCFERNPSYIILPHEQETWGEDEIFICDILKKFVGRNVCITIKETK